MLKFYIASFVAFMSAAAVFASPVLMESHGAWRVFKAENDGKLLCYIGSVPAKSEGNYSKRGDAYLLVAHIAGNQDEVSVSAGYALKENQDVKVQIDQRAFDFFSKGDLAWTYDADADKELVKEMFRGSDVVVRAESWKDTSSKDTYSLSGFAEAHRAMNRLCE